MTQRVKSTPKFCIQKAFQKGPLHLIHSFRLNQLQNKINFFQGQVDPLLEDNISLKEQLINLSKLVESSTEILRKLLVTQNNPNKRLKLQMASIQEIANIIKEDWHRMEVKLADNAQTIKKLREDRDNWRDCFEQEKSNRAREVFQLQQLSKQNKISYEQKITSLQKSLSSLEFVHEQQKKQMRMQFAQSIKDYQFQERQFERYKRQVKDKQQEYEKKILRLNRQIDANLLSFEQTRKNIKAIYDKLMTDKLSEQAEGFELLLKMKEQQKMQMMISMGDAEDEYKRRAAKKQSQIAKLTQRNESYRQEVGHLKSDIWNKQLQLDKQFQQARHKDLNIARLEAQNKQLVKKMEQKEQEYTQHKIELQRIIRSKNQELQVLRQEGSESIQKSLAIKAALEKELTQKQQKLRQTLLSLRKKDQTWQKQIQKLREEWKSQQESIKKQLQEQQKINKAWNDKLQQFQRQKAQLIKDQTDVLKRIQDAHKEHQYILQSQYLVKLKQLKQAQEMEIATVKILHQRQLSQANITANESLREFMANCNRRMNQQEFKFLAQKNQYEIEIKQRDEQAEKAEKRLLQAENVIKKNEIEHNQAIRHMNAAAELEKQRLEKQNHNQMKVFLEQMEKQEARLSQIKAEMEKQIAMLKQSNAIETIENRFLSQINKLKEQFAEKMKKNEQSYKMIEQAQAQAHRNKVNSLKQNFNQDLIKIADKVQQKSVYLNERLITGFNDPQFIQMTQDKKKQYIINKVEYIQKKSFQKDKKIQQLEFSLDQAEKNIEKRVKARKQELQRQKQKFAKECSQKVETITNECKKKVAQAEKDRIQHSHSMYVEFQALREHHQGLLNALNKKYLQLQILFEQRPSRMEDLTKIKELTNMQMKLDIEIQSYQKKMETANEIVKYLHLELQNYKDSYDIFGPNGENITGGIVGVSAIRGSNNGGNNVKSETQHILQVIKSHHHGSEAKIVAEQRKQLSKEQLAYRKWNEKVTPALKQLKIFQDDQSQQSVVQSRDFSESKQDKKYSYLIVDKNSQRKNRFKTQRSEKIEHQSQILINAQNFIKLIKGSNEDTPPPVVRQLDQERRKSYRKRKLHKRQPTQGFDHYF